MTRLTFIALASLFLLVFALPPGAPARADDAAGSLPSVSGGARPGPDVLYAPAPAAPQLENRDARFNAAPLLVSGTEAYVDGEYIYQDYLYDDYGSDTDGRGSGPLSQRVGNIDYPTDFARYGGNAADIVEFRIDVAEDSVAYRITLNTLLVPDSTIILIAFDTDRNAATGRSIAPRDPGAPFPGTEQTITTWGTGAVYTREIPGQSGVVGFPASTVDLEANQITVTVPRSWSNPQGIWRTTVAAGIYDTYTQLWMKPGVGPATATRSGGPGPLDTAPSGIMNLAFRFDEPVVRDDTPPDANQSVAIRDKAPTRYARDIDFAALDAGENRTTVPSSGTQIRIFPSRLQLGEGRNLNEFPAYLGQLQPYSLYVPSTYTPGTAAGLTLNLHSLSEHHWQYNGSRMVQQIGEQRGNFVATSLSRGDDGWYRDIAEYDVFEMWNDIARHFTLDPDKAAISGYSMGGYATYRLGSLYPDLFGKAFSQVGPPGEGIWVPPAPPTGGTRGSQTGGGTDGMIETLTNVWLENTRNLPYLNLAGVEDELVPYVGPRAQNLGAPEHGIRGFDQLGYRFRFITYPVGDHFALAVLDDYPMAAEFLGDAHVDRNPAHVTFSYVPATDFADLGLVHDHAYWVSGLELADEEGAAAKGTIDVLSHAFGVGDPASSPYTTTGVGPLPFVEAGRTWDEAPAIPAANRLDVTLTNLAEATVDTARAGIDPCQDLSLAIASDRPSRLALASYRTPLSVTGAAFEATPEGPVLVVSAGDSVVTVVPDCRAADLQVIHLSADQASGGRVRLTAVVANLGDLAAGATQTQVAVDGAPLASMATPSLAPGETTTLTFTWDARRVSGEHEVSAVADHTKLVDESNEGNNGRSLTLFLFRGRLL